MAHALGEDERHVDHWRDVHRRIRRHNPLGAAVFVATVHPCSEQFDIEIRGLDTEDAEITEFLNTEATEPAEENASGRATRGVDSNDTAIASA